MDGNAKHKDRKVDDELDELLDSELFVRILATLAGSLCSLKMKLLVFSA